MHRSYPFDPLLKHHIIIALGLALWVFLFLVLTEPLDTDVFSTTEKLTYLPLYGIAAALTYLLIVPLQYALLKWYQQRWTLLAEILFLTSIIFIGFLLARFVYLYFIVPDEPNPYTLAYFGVSIYLPAIATILPMLAIGRWAFGRYFEKKLDDQKIEIPGEGTYEGLRLSLTDLISVKADDNYVEVCFLDNGSLKKNLIRNKLSTIETLIPELLRTHRSYLINPYHFQQFKMDSGKLQIILGTEITIPVSKTYAERVKSNFV